MLMPPSVGLMLCSIAVSRTRYEMRLPGLQQQLYYHWLHDLSYFTSLCLRSLTSNVDIT